jgi:hypothetical protein
MKHENPKTGDWVKRDEAKGSKKRGELGLLDRENGKVLAQKSPSV